jgi:hypothetical protein
VVRRRPWTRSSRCCSRRCSPERWGPRDAAALSLPLLWGKPTYDTLGTLGSLFTRRLDDQSRAIGAALLTLGGIVFALFYGWMALMFYTGTFTAPQYVVLRDFPTTIDLFYPLVGLVGGFGQGIFASLILAFVVVDFHPVESQRRPFDLCSRSWSATPCSASW